MAGDIKVHDNKLSVVEGARLVAPISEEEPTTDLVEAITKAARTDRVTVLDTGRCRKELSEAGLEMPDLNELANSLAEGRQLRESLMPVGGALLALGGGVFAVLLLLFLAADVTGVGAFKTAALYWLGAVVGVGALGGVCAYAYTNLGEVERDLGDVLNREVPIPALTRRRRALRIAAGCVSQHGLGWEEAQLLKRAREAAAEVVNSDVWDDEMFDTHRVRVDLVEAVRRVAGHVRVIASNTSGGNVVPHAVHREALEAVREEVKALEQYRDQVVKVQDQLRRLDRAEREELGSVRLADWMTKNSSGDGQVAELRNLAADSAAASEAIVETLEAMGPTSAWLASGSV